MRTCFFRSKDQVVACGQVARDGGHVVRRLGIVGARKQVSAVLQQEGDDRAMPAPRRDHWVRCCAQPRARGVKRARERESEQGRRARRTEGRLAVLCGCVDVGAAPDEEPCDVDVAVAAGVVQRRPPERVAVADVGCLKGTRATGER